MLIATACEVARELGLPALIGAVAGALIAHYAAKSRGREDHERTLEVLARRDERDAALEIFNAARDIRKRAEDSEALGSGAVFAEWQERVLVRARLVCDDDLYERAATGETVIFLAQLLAGTDEHTAYAVGLSIADVEAFVRAWLRQEPAPPPRLPDRDKVQELAVSLGGGKISMGPLTSLLSERLRNGVEGEVGDGPEQGV